MEFNFISGFYFSTCEYKELECAVIFVKAVNLSEGNTNVCSIFAESWDKQGIIETVISPTMVIPEFASTPRVEFLSISGAL